MPRTHMVKDEKWVMQVVLWPPHTRRARTHTDINKITSLDSPSLLRQWIQSQRLWKTKQTRTKVYLFIFIIFILVWNYCDYFLVSVCCMCACVLRERPRVRVHGGQSFDVCCLPQLLCRLRFLDSLSLYLELPNWLDHLANGLQESSFFCPTGAEITRVFDHT